MFASIGPRSLLHGANPLQVVVSAILLVGLEPLPASCFNLEPRTAKIFSDPTLGQSYWGRESYFGFSVALQRNALDQSAWLVVGAPRANSSIYIPTSITEPGAIFKCDLSSDESCRELKIDPTGNTYTPNQNHEFSYQDFKNEGWLGAALDTQPTFKEGRQATGVCAPRWINQAYVGHGTYQMNGACYWLNVSLPDVPAHKKLPLIQYSKQTFNLKGQALFYYAHGQAGLSLHFPDDQTEMIVGAPGVFNWKGSVIRFKDAKSPVLGEMAFRRRRRQANSFLMSEAQMFSSQNVPNPFYTDAIDDFDLNGYAVASGRFFKEDELLYVSGAPRGSETLGKVYMFTFPDRETQELNIRAVWHGSQVGEYFGASLLAVDVNGDGLSDLVVGAPMFSRRDLPDIGRIQTFVSTKSSSLVRTGSLYGSSAPSARFGTTLASPGDLDYDGHADIAVGAPWENDGKGAVYIYMGANEGLRPIYAQRLSPEDFPTMPNLYGFGMGISRGADIDNNDYPDMAIGSFLSGHAVVLRSRTVASVVGYVSATPTTLLLEDTYLTIDACISYDGHKVPTQIGIHGNVTLDYGHPSPRATFSDSRLPYKNFNVLGHTGKTKCLPFRVDISKDKIDPRRPILIRLEYAIPEAGGQLMVQPKTDPGKPTVTTLPISIVTECESDGDKTCEVDMFVKAYFVSYGEYDKLTIGGDNKPILEIVVQNLGESVFLPNVTVEVPEPFALYLPSSHNCDFLVKDSRSALVCQLANPIKRNKKDWVQVTIDASQVTDTTSELKVDVAVSGEGVELEPTDNIVIPELQLLANAQLKLHGYSRDEQLLYKKMEGDKINTTLSSSTFTHHYTLVKSGPTPLGQVELVVDIPINFTSDINFITLYAPETDFLGQPFLCNVEGATLKAIRIVKDDNGNVIPSFAVPEATRTHTTILQGRSTVGNANDDESSLHEVHTFRCTNPEISCARVRCQINSWPSGSNNADFSIRMDVNFTTLASRIFARGGAVLGSTATASVLSLNPDLTFVGNTVASTIADTQFLPDSLPRRGVAWWIILLAILGGLLLLTALAYLLHKMGFFKRKEHEEMMAQKATIECNANY